MGLVQVAMIVLGVAFVYAIWEYGTDIMIVASSIRRRYWSIDFSNLMSRLADEGDYSEDNEEPDISPATTTPQNNNNALQSGATYSNALLEGQARALAAMVKANKIGETEGIKMVFGVSPSSTNPRYIAARAALKSALEKLDNPFPLMTPEQKKAREALGLNKAN